MNACLTLLAVLVSLAAAQSDLSPAMDQLRASLGSLRQRVVLCIVDPGSAREPARWFAHLPLAVQVSVGLGDAQMRQLKELTARDEKPVVLVPRSSAEFRRRVMGVLESDAFKISLARVVFVLEPGETLPYDEFPEAACLVVALNGVTADVASDQYRDCARRRTSSGAPFLGGDSFGRTWPSLKGRRFRVVTRYAPRPGGVSYNWTMIPEAAALLEALQRLNVTVEQKSFYGTGKVEDRLYHVIQRKLADISLLPAHLSEEENARVYLGAVSSFRSLAFFSRRGSKVAPHLLPSLLSSALILTSVFFCGLCVAGVYGAQGCLAGHRVGMSDMVLYLMANLLGRCSDPPPSSGYAATRLLCAFWAFGMLSFCAYLQSVFTSEISVPTVSRDISTMEDLRRFAEAGKVLPCLDRYSFSQKFLLSSETGIASLLSRLLLHCSDACVNDRDTFYCYRLARKGTHVYLRVHDAYMSYYPTLFDLAPGTDVFRYSPSAVMTPKGFPHGRALRHLVLVQAQSGAVAAEQTRMRLRDHVPFLGAPPDPPVQVSFWEHFYLYILGSLVAVLCFLLEAVWSRVRRARAVRQGKRSRRRARAWLN